MPPVEPRTGLAHRCGVEVRKLETQGDAGHHTTFITFEDVKVPLENLCREPNPNP